MAMVDTQLAVVRLDHGVFPSDDLGRSLVFFTDVLGAEFKRLVNVNLRGLNREVPEKTIYFYDPFGNRLQVSENRPHR